MTDKIDYTSVTGDEALLEELNHLFPDEIDGGDTNLKAALQNISKHGGPSALCLSGGGIRSATFSLGILQAFAERKWLDGFDYLSTVSGGGFIGCWLSRWRANDPNWDQAQLAETKQTPGRTHPVRGLRSFSNYLAPGSGSSDSALTFLVGAAHKFIYNFLFWCALLICGAMVARLCANNIVVSDLAANNLFGPLSESIFGARTNAVGWHALTAILSITLVLQALLLVIGFALGRFRQGLSEQISRVSGLSFALCALAVLGTFAFVIIPDFLEHQGPSLIIFTAASGTLTAVSGYWSKIGPDVIDQGRNLKERVNISYLQVISLISIALICIAMGWIGLQIYAGLQGLEEGAIEPEFLHPFIIRLTIVIILASALFFGSVAGPNRSSLHSLYSDRLTRAFLGSANQLDDGLTNDIALSDIPTQSSSKKNTPPKRKPLFHLINMTLNLSPGAGNRQDWHERRGGSFTASPLHVGSAALGKGYAASNDVFDKATGKGLTLGRAMAISGAAASPNMGYYSNFLTTMAMTIFNVRLGWWLQNPAKEHHNRKTQDEPWLGFLQVFREALSRLSSKAKWVYLSDGGHFDNLGLYEIVRRRCTRIVVIDAGCDPDFEYSDLHSVTRKIQVDFGIPIDLPSSLPGQKGAGNNQRFVVGTIRYSAQDPALKDGKLIIIKSVMLGNEPPVLANYQETSRSGKHAFPHHSTADQFFDETQFESYRQLGYLSAFSFLELHHNKGTSSIKNAKFKPLYYPGLDKNSQPQIVASGAGTQMPVAANNPATQSSNGGAGNSNSGNGNSGNGANGNGGFGNSGGAQTGGFGTLISAAKDWSMTEAAVKAVAAAAVLSGAVHLGGDAVEKAGDGANAIRRAVDDFLTSDDPPPTPPGPKDDTQAEVTGNGDDGNGKLDIAITECDEAIADRPLPEGTAREECEVTEPIIEPKDPGYEKRIKKMENTLANLKIIDHGADHATRDEVKALENDLLIAKNTIADLSTSTRKNNKADYQIASLQNQITRLLQRVNGISPQYNVSGQ